MSFVMSCSLYSLIDVPPSSKSLSLFFSQCNTQNGLILYTDDELDVEEFLNNGVPVYGRQTVGSFGNTLTRNDIRVMSLLVLRTENKLTLTALIKELNAHKLNFVVMVSSKTRSDSVQFFHYYVYAAYADEIYRFLNMIRSEDGYSFRVSGHHVKVRLAESVRYGHAASKQELLTDARHVSNLHFNFAPDPSVSPTQNLLTIAEKTEGDYSLPNDIAGISVKINMRKLSLYPYGTFTLYNGVDKTACINRLERVGLVATEATFSSFILMAEQSESLQRIRRNMFQEDSLMLNYNALSNGSIIDNFERVAIPNSHVLSTDLISMAQLTSVLPEIIRGALSQVAAAPYNNSFGGGFSRQGNIPIAERLGAIAYGGRVERRSDRGRGRGRGRGHGLHYNRGSQRRGHHRRH
jgi:hypothetical protein